MVRRANQQGHPPWILRRGWGVGHSHSRLPRRLQPGPYGLRLDSVSGRLWRRWLAVKPFFRRNTRVWRPERTALVSAFCPLVLPSPQPLPGLGEEAGRCPQPRGDSAKGTRREDRARQVTLWSRTGTITTTSEAWEPKTAPFR